MSCVCNASKVHPDYYGQGMVIAVAFRVQSVRHSVVSQVDSPQDYNCPFVRNDTAVIAESDA